MPASGSLVLLMSVHPGVGVVSFNHGPWPERWMIRGKSSVFRSRRRAFTQWPHDGSEGWTDLVVTEHRDTPEGLRCHLDYLRQHGCCLGDGAVQIASLLPGTALEGWEETLYETPSQN